MKHVFESLANTTRLLFTVELRPIQGDRFQPTGFPSLGAATYQTKNGPKLLVESAQSMANRLETTCWDFTADKPIRVLDGISHVTVTRGGRFLTDTMLEAHRLNSPYLLTSDDRRFLDPFLADLREKLGPALVDENEGLVNRKALASVIMKYDVGSILHGCFLSSNQVRLTPSAKKGSPISGGRLRVARALSAFIEATNVRVAASGGVKNDHVNPSGVTKDGFGNVPFARDEFSADRIDCHINLDLAQIRGYGFGEPVEKLLVLLSLHRVRKLLDGDLRLRTACDLEPVDRDAIMATRPAGFALPAMRDIEEALPVFISECKESMTHESITFEGPLKKGKEEAEGADAGDDEGETEAESGAGSDHEDGN